MAGAQTTLKGVVHGKTIGLEQEPALRDGQSVLLPPGEGIRRSAGAWADDPEGLDEYLEQLRHDGAQDRRPIEP
jgi:hypothetical protein